MLLQLLSTDRYWFSSVRQNWIATVPYRLKSAIAERSRNRSPDNPEHLTKTTSPRFPFLPPSSSSRLMLLYLQPSPRIRGVETTSRHFVCADRPSETGEITERRSDSGERLQPLREAPREESFAKSCPCYRERGGIAEKIRRQWRENRAVDKYICVHEKEILRKIQGRGCFAERRQRGEAEEGCVWSKRGKTCEKGKTSTWKIIMCPSRRKERVRIDNYINKLLPGRRERWKERRV